MGVLVNGVSGAALLEHPLLTKWRCFGGRSFVLWIEALPAQATIAVHAWTPSVAAHAFQALPESFLRQALSRFLEARRCSSPSHSWATSSYGVRSGLPVEFLRSLLDAVRFESNAFGDMWSLVIPGLSMSSSASVNVGPDLEIVPAPGQPPQEGSTTPRKVLVSPTSSAFPTSAMSEERIQKCSPLARRLEACLLSGATPSCRVHTATLNEIDQRREQCVPNACSMPSDCDGCHTSLARNLFESASAPSSPPKDVANPERRERRTCGAFASSEPPRMEPWRPTNAFGHLLAASVERYSKSDSPERFVDRSPEPPANASRHGAFARRLANIAGGFANSDSVTDECASAKCEVREGSVCEKLPHSRSHCFARERMLPAMDPPRLGVPVLT